MIKLRPLIQPKNNKGGVMLIIIFFIALFVILFIGFIMVVGSAIVNWTFDEVMPELTNIGTIGDNNETNMSQIAKSTLTPVNTIVQNLTFMTGVLYIIMLVGSFGLILIARTTTSRWLIGFYFMGALILIIGSIFISNIYEEFYNDTGDFADRLKEHTILSYMILYSPAIFTIIVFLAGILLFSGMQEEDQYV